MDGKDTSKVRSATGVRLVIAGVAVGGGLAVMSVAVLAAAADGRAVIAAWKKIGQARTAQTVPTRRVETVDNPVLLASDAVRAEAAGLSQNTQVIGVVAGGKARAYLVSALASVRRHVVNDRVGRVPVVVTYCDLMDCARAFTAPSGDKLTEVATGGRAMDGTGSGMLLRVGPYRYFQKTAKPLDPGAPAFPYTPVAIERTSWAEWVTAHPDTDVYLGGPDDMP